MTKLVFDGKPVDFRKVAREGTVHLRGVHCPRTSAIPAPGSDGWPFTVTGGKRVKNAFFLLCNQRLSVNWEFQKAAAAALVDPAYPAYLADMKKKLTDRRDTFVKMAEHLPLSFPKPRGAFYAFMKIETEKWRKDLQFVRAALKEGVVFVPGSGFGRQEDGVYFRTTFLPSPRIIEEAFDKIKRILQSEGSSAGCTDRGAAGFRHFLFHLPGQPLPLP
ncbi:MAG: aminotransferase class I/II-fold pyridoxal phosphate-dependent enzyme [Desulfobacterales bacterium]|nr:aminotransferase class I/II-fold pyridoxal phosphate-dependent enzyme [Desulfobacterales bacterium]